MSAPACGGLETCRHIGRHFELMREYRERLIADIVTGKLDVREAVAGLGDSADTVEHPGDLEN